MDATIVDLLKSAKYKHKFPPRHRMLQIKSDLVAKGLLHSGAAITLITETYSESGAEAVLDDFVETVIQNRSSLSLESEEVLLNLVADAFTNVIVEARGCALSEFASNDRFKQLALNHFNEKVPYLGALAEKSPPKGIGSRRQDEPVSNNRQSDWESCARFSESIRADR